MSTSTAGTMILSFTCIHNRVCGILRRWSTCAPTAYGEVRDCRKLEKHWHSLCEIRLVGKVSRVGFTHGSSYRGQRKVLLPLSTTHLNMSNAPATTVGSNAKLGLQLRIEIAVISKVPSPGININMLEVCYENRGSGGGGLARGPTATRISGREHRATHMLCLTAQTLHHYRLWRYNFCCFLLGYLVVRARLSLPRFTEPVRTNVNEPRNMLKLKQR
jgi:hypothetical protein